jgi:hypothetical protein
MSFESIETSEYDNEPRELYWFMRGAESWTYTSGAHPVEFDGHTFEPVAGLSRSNTRDGGERSRSQLTVTMPRDTEIARMFVGIPETQALWMYLYRIHDGESGFRLSWQGRVRFNEFSGNTAKLTLDNILTSTKKAGLRHLFQGQCNHFTFDSNCGLSEVAFSTAGVSVDAIDGNFIEISNSQAAGYYVAGQVKRANGDRRFIVTDTKASSVHTLELLTPFEDMELGEEVTIIGGACRHNFATCQIVKQADGTTIDNSEHYGGYPKVPRKNPFKSFH